MSLFHCKNCNALFDTPNETYVGNNNFKFTCPQCSSRDVDRVAS
jgi:Zn finger protein HypA/HybF involved in hydrogenase expression